MRFGQKHPAIGTVVWGTWFAWRPVRFERGGWAWLERIKVRYKFAESVLSGRGLWIRYYYPIEQLEFPPRD